MKLKKLVCLLLALLMLLGLALPAAGASSGHLVHHGPALRLAAELEHVPRVGLCPHDHVNLRARGG